jgi:hypothetical protein
VGYYEAVYKNLIGGTEENNEYASQHRLTGPNLLSNGIGAIVLGTKVDGT